MRFIPILLLLSVYSQATAQISEFPYPSPLSHDFRIGSLSVRTDGRVSYSAQTIAGHFEQDNIDRRFSVNDLYSEVVLFTDENPAGKFDPLDIDVHAASIDNRARASVSNATALADFAIITERTKDGLTINGDFFSGAETMANNSHAEASVSAAFRIETRGPQDVVIIGCDLFDYVDEIENSPLVDQFSWSGTTCSFSVGTASEYGDDGRAFTVALEARVSASTYQDDPKNEQNSGQFSITVAPTCPSDTPIVRVNTDGPLNSCLNPLISAINGNFPGLIRIGGRWPRCISQTNLPVIDPARWYTATGGSCAHANFNDRHRERPGGRFDSVPNHALRVCSAPGPRLDRFEVYAVTGGGCRMGGYRSNPSPHHSGHALDFFVSDTNVAPNRCQAIAGDRIRDWLLNEAATNNTIQNIIWNESEYPRSNNFGAQAISSSGDHHDHVHVRCSP